MDSIDMLREENKNFKMNCFGNMNNVVVIEKDERNETDEIGMIGRDIVVDLANMATTTATVLVIVKIAIVKIDIERIGGMIADTMMMIIGETETGIEMMGIGIVVVILEGGH